MNPHRLGNFPLALVLAAALVAGCGGAETPDGPPGSGGSLVSSGGASPSNGGGSNSGGNTTAAGGQTSSGGLSSTAGAASGGAAGGSSSTAGTSTGGQSTGGTGTAGTPSGGRATGGTSTSGGQSTSGGRSSSGGRSPAGGSAETGGTAVVTGGTGGVAQGGSSSGGSGGVVEDGPYTVSSPDGRIKAELSTTDSILRYRITADGKQILAPSEIGLRSSGVEIGRDVVLGTIERRSVDEEYDFLGGRTPAINQANEGSVPATSGTEAFTVDLHVANDGVGIRLRLAAKAGRKVEAERSVWRFEGNPTVWATTLEAAYEQHYRTTALNSLGSSSYGMPLTAKVDDLYVSITEAALKDYGDTALKRGTSGALEGTLYADPSGWSTDAAVVQPWRVTIIGRDLTALVNSTLVQNLNPPRDASLSGADWIRPGRSTWQWMAVGAPVFADQNQWVDWTEQLGFEYYLVDDGWKAWSDAWNSLKSVCTYAAGKGVKIWLWVNSNEVKDASARQSYFKQAADAGVVGVKIDFPPACDRWWSTWYWDVAKDAAQHKLLVDVHGANKPTGIERTWPNMLTREAIRGHEYQMTRYDRVLEPAHDTILPFTRYVAGAGDYTPTVYAAQELQGNTWAHELAQAVVFTSPFLCFGGHPKDYVANTAADVMKAIPAVWDETIVLTGSEPGKVAAFARKSGSSWFVGILNGAEATTLEVKLGFLGTGTWNAIRLGDVASKADAWDRQEGTASAADSIQVSLSSRGGFVAWFKQ